MDRPVFFPDSKAEDTREAGSASLAVAVSFAVLLAGAAFLAVAMTAAPATPDAARQAKAAAGETVLASRPVSNPAPSGPLSPETIASPAPEAGSAAGEEGLAPRLSPTRLASLETPAETELAPRLKPGASMAAGAVAAAPMVSFGQVFRAGAEDAPPPFFFEHDLAPRRAPPPPPAVAYAGDISDGPRPVRVSLAKGETFVDAMRRAGVRAADRNAAAYAFGEHQNLRALRPGQEFALTTTTPNRTLFQLAAESGEPEAYLLTLDFQADAENKVSLRRTAEGGFAAMKSTHALTTRLVGVSGRIDGSLYLSAKRVGAPDMVIAELADMFAYDIDFQREIFGGDEFEAIFEVRYDENGAMVGAGDILYGRLKWRGRQKEKGYYRFASEEGGRGDYFDRTGASARRLLMKTPIDGARLSSGFGTRRHPILGYARAHKGLDFAAPRGTPIKAAGSGTVERADWYGSFGNYVRIRHANGYKTAYAHLNGFSRGMKAGKKVSQGDIIGYVGTTGRSTGPHLHYEVHHNGAAVNPQTLKMATGVTLAGAELDRFKAVRDMIDAMRQPTEPAAPEMLAREETGGRSAL